MKYEHAYITCLHNMFTSVDLHNLEKSKMDTPEI